MQVTSEGTSTPSASASCAVEQQQIAALEAVNALLNATVAAQAAEIAGLRSRLLGRSESHYAPASTPIAAQPPPPPPILRSGDGGTAPNILFLPHPPPCTHALALACQPPLVVAHILPRAHRTHGRAHGIYGIHGRAHGIYVIA